MKKQMTVLGVLGILTCLSFSNAQAQVFVSIGVSSTVCHPRVVYHQPPACNHHGHCNHHIEHHHHGNNGHHNRQQGCGNNYGRGNGRRY